MEENKVNKPKSPSMISSNKSFSTSKNVKPMTSVDKAAPTPSVVVGSEKITQTTVAPRNLKKFFAILVAILLSILVGVSFVLILLYPKPVRPSDISLDFIVDTNIIISGEDLDTGRKVMPGDKIDYSFELQTKTNQETDESVDLRVFLRIRASIITENNYYSNVVNLHFIDNDQWYKGGDGYYYLTKIDYNNEDDGLLSPDEKIRIIRDMEIDKSLGNEYAGKPIQILFDAEVLQAKYQAIAEIWPTAPYEWASQFKYLTW